MYLENIFIGSEDIRKQLPQESVLFDAIHNTFMRYMKQLVTVRRLAERGLGCPTERGLA